MSQEAERGRSLAGSGGLSGGALNVTLRRRRAFGEGKMDQPSDRDMPQTPAATQDKIEYEPWADEAELIRLSRLWMDVLYQREPRGGGRPDLAPDNGPRF